eukprot:1430447-Rhodomonas_salina.1
MLDVTYSGPDTHEEDKPIPSVGYDQAKCEIKPADCPCGRGWCSRWYYSPAGADALDAFPDLTDVNPHQVRRLPDISLLTPNDFKRFSKADNSKIAITFDGMVYVRGAGDYEICLESDDGSKLFLNGEEVVAKAPDGKLG